jgi:hypothetical protein
MPPVADDLSLAPLELGEGKEVLSVPAQAFLRVLDVAEREGLERRLPFGRELVDLSEKVGLVALTRVVGEHVDFVRAGVRLERGDGPWGGWLDLPTRYVGMMIEAAKPREAEPEVSNVHFRDAGVRPRWAGSHTFDRVWDAAFARGAEPEAGVHGEEGVTTGPGKVLAVEHLRLLRDAHLVRIEADQVELLPDWDDAHQAFDYAVDLELPFEPLFLEFEGAGGIAPTLRIPTELLGPPEDPIAGLPIVVVIRGALVSKTGSVLTVQPFGEIFFTKERSGVQSYVPSGRVEFGRETFGGPPFGRQELVAAMPQGRLRAEAAAMTIEAAASIYPGDAAGARGLIVLPYEYDRLGAGEDEISQEAAEVWARIELVLAMRVLAALSIMESEVVVVEEAAVEKRVRDRARKRGWNIASQVYVRPVRKGAHYEPTGEHRHYSHRFWVRGHMKHYPIGTRLATHRPDLVRPCTRTGAASCGLCRRVWTPPFVKGPDDKPIVLKSLVKKVERDESAA